MKLRTHTCRRCKRGNTIELLVIRIACSASTQLPPPHLNVPDILLLLWTHLISRWIILCCVLHMWTNKPNFLDLFWSFHRVETCSFTTDYTGTTHEGKTYSNLLKYLICVLVELSKHFVSLKITNTDKVWTWTQCLLPVSHEKILKNQEILVALFSSRIMQKKKC